MSLEELIGPTRDLFSGADGGGGFVRLRVFIEQILEKENHSEHDKIILDKIEQMSRMCYYFMK
jgi:hypothetical protein